MAGNPFFSGRIPKELNDSVIKHCKETGKSKTQVLVEALSNYLNIPVPENSTNLRVEITKEQFISLENRVTSLEALLGKDIVITTDISDNNNNSSEETKMINSDNNTYNIDNTENKFEKTSYDNNSENNDNAKNISLASYENIGTKKLLQLADLKTSEGNNLKSQVFKKAQKEGYEINKNLKFNPPIEGSLRKGIYVGQNKYKLLCKGIDDNEKPIWSLEPDDNASYQPDILSNNHYNSNC